LCTTRELMFLSTIFLMNFLGSTPLATSDDWETKSAGASWPDLLAVPRPPNAMTVGQNGKERRAARPPPAPVPNWAPYCEPVLALVFRTASG